MPEDPLAPIAHRAEDGRSHLLSEHLREVGRLAREFACRWGAGDFGQLAGELHDLGKYADDFQRYIRDSSRSPLERRDAHVETDATPTPARGRVDHSSAGAIAARNEHGPLGELVAYVIAGHHAGLADRPNLRARMERKSERLQAARRGIPPTEQLPTIELQPPFELRASSADAAPALQRRVEMWIRMLFSALCDADFLDTEAFFDAEQAGLRGAARAVPLQQLLQRLTAHVDQLQDGSVDTEVNRVRRVIREAAVKCAAAPPGIFALTVPTGGGKTLTGMEFALSHALHNGLERVIVAIPYMSIIEQNAEIYRKALADDQAVLEHHSSFDPKRETARSRLAAQNWDVPVVVTTTVQLFESLFARRPSHCRKLHNLARSVIVLDEVQTLPPGLLEPTLEALASLVGEYGASLVLSTATQPAFGRSSLRSFGFDSMTEIVPGDIRAFDRLKRVDVFWPMSTEPTPYSVIAGELADRADVLAITHRRNDARKLAELVDAEVGDTATTHLSALMCPEHRSDVLRRLMADKRRGRPVRLISTQLVEAGVDLDFPVVYRAFAGLDSLAQAAGRCNREGHLERGELRVFIAETSPPPGVLSAGQAIAMGMLRTDPDLDLFAPASHKTYFERLYAAASTDARDIQASRANLLFEETARRYRLIEDDWSLPIVVPYRESLDLVESIRRFGPSRDRLRRLGRFSVNAPARLVNQWLIHGDAEQDEESGVISLAYHVAAYDDRFGLIPERVSAGMDVGTLIIDG